MSMNDGKKRNATGKSDGGGGAPVPTDKRQKTNEPADTAHSLLLDIQPEILRKVCSFLRLKVALSLRQVHRKFNNELCTDLYQYSFIMYSDALKERGFDKNYCANYLMNHTLGLCNLVDNENLQAVLRNETLPSGLARDFMHHLVKDSKTDNGQAVSILLQDGRCKVNTDHLEQCLRKGFTSMALALQQDERVKKDIQMCRTCSKHIGCYDCTNYDECVVGEEPRYCRECVLKDDSFCKECSDYLCPSCFERGLYSSCEKCGGIECRVCPLHFLMECDGCHRKKCKPCIKEDGGVWFELENGQTPCRNCASTLHDKVYGEAIDRFRSRLEEY